MVEDKHMKFDRKKPPHKADPNLKDRSWVSQLSF